MSFDVSLEVELPSISSSSTIGMGRRKGETPDELWGRRRERGGMLWKGSVSHSGTAGLGRAAAGVVLVPSELDKERVPVVIRV